MISNRSLLRGHLRIPGRGITTAALIAALVSICLTPTASAQQAIRLPIEASLNTPRLELDLSDADVRITISAEQPPRFSARLKAADEAAEIFIEATVLPGLTSVRRNETHTLPRIVVEITLTEDHHFAVYGDRINLDIVGLEPDSQAENTAPTGRPIAGPSADRGGADQSPEEAPNEAAATVAVKDSQLTATDLRSLSLAAVRGTNDISFTSGLLALDLQDSEVHVRGHQGHTELVSVDSITTFDDCGGTISADVGGGRLTVNQGEARIKGTFGTADAVFEGVSGPIDLTGTESSFSIIDTPNVPIQIKGEDLRVSLSGLGGTLRATLNRGSLDADSISGRVDLQLTEEAEGDLDDVQGDLAAVISTGARAVVRGVKGHTRIRLQDGEAEVMDLKSLELNLRQSFFAGSGIRALTRLSSLDSTLDLVLHDIEGRPKIELHGSSVATIELRTPCRVVAKMPQSPIGDNLRVTGCLLDFDGARKKGMARGVDGRMPLRLEATLDENARLEVDGAP